MQYSSVAGASTIKTTIRIGLFCCKTDIKWYCQKILHFSKFEFWVVRDMLHSQLPHTYQPLDTFVNLMILMNLVHQIWLKKFLVSACKRILLLDVQLSITKAILPNISDVLIFPIYNVYKQSHVFISFLRIFKNTLNYIFQKLSNPELNWNYSS